MYKERKEEKNKKKKRDGRTEEKIKNIYGS